MRNMTFLFLMTSLCITNIAQATETKKNLLHKIKLHKEAVSKNKVSKPINTSSTTTHAEETPLSLSGYVDSSYNYLIRSSKFTSGTYNRIYDIEPNGITIHQIALTFAKNASSNGVGGIVNLIGGRDSTQIASYGFQPRSLGFDITQVAAQFVKNSFTLTAGKFVSIAGSESINTTLNNNFSRSFLYGYAIPKTVMGLRLNFQPNEKVNLLIGVNNGWDNIRDTGRRKTLELGSMISLNSFKLLASIYSGEERVIPFTDNGPTGTRNLLDINAIYQISPKLNLVANLDFARQNNALLPNNVKGKATWEGVAAYLNYQLNGAWKTSLRAEIFNDKDGYRTGVKQNLKELTFTVGYSPLKNVDVRAEIRHDFSNTASFVKSYNGMFSNNQQSYALEAIYIF